MLAVTLKDVEGSKGHSNQLPTILLAAKLKGGGGKAGQNNSGSKK
jgi:hypothetical protein